MNQRETTCLHCTSKNEVHFTTAMLLMTCTKKLCSSSTLGTVAMDVYLDFGIV